MGRRFYRTWWGLLRLKASLPSPSQTVRLHAMLPLIGVDSFHTRYELLQNCLASDPMSLLSTSYSGPESGCLAWNQQHGPLGGTYGSLGKV